MLVEDTYSFQGENVSITRTLYRVDDPGYCDLPAHSRTMLEGGLVVQVGDYVFLVLLNSVNDDLQESKSRRKVIQTI